MIKYAHELTQDAAIGLRGGEGKATITKLLEKDELQGKARLFNKVTLEPGASIGLHAHTDDVEAYYILNGEGIVADNGEQKAIKSGDIMFTGNEESHSIKNTGNTDLVFIALILLA